MGASPCHFRALWLLEEPLPADPAPPLGEAEDRLFRMAAERLCAHPGLISRPFGSAFDADPWPAQLPQALHPALFAALRERCVAQGEGALPTLTFRTTSGASLITLEDHHEDVVVAARYLSDTGRPAAQVSELPADAQAVFSGMRLRTAAELIADVDSEVLATATAAVRGLSAVWHDDLALVSVLHRLKSHADWQLRGAVVAAAQRLGHRLFLQQLLAVEQHPSLRRILETCTAYPRATPGSPG